jgi:hypothetical protein
MNAGRACLSCHASGQTPALTLAGTVYTTATGGTAVSGATVTIVDSNGITTKLVTTAQGNFFTGAAIAFPATVSVSKCPNIAVMPTQVTSGDCNSCHGSTMRIHLP